MYQRSDSAYYMQVAQEVYLVGQRDGLGKALHFAYFHRHWKPVAMHLAMAPFIAFNHGDTRAAFFWYGLFWSALFCLSLFRFLGQLLPEKSVLAALLCLSFPWLVVAQLLFGLEFPWLTFCALSLSYALDSELLAKVRATWLCLLCIFFATLFRPAETFVLFLPFVLGSLVAAVMRGKISWLAFLGILIEAAAIAGIILYPYFFMEEEYSRHVQFWIVAIGTIYLASKILLKRKSPFNIQVSTLLFLFLFWILPFCRNLLHWLHNSTFDQNSIGILSSAYHQRLAQSFPALYLDNSGYLLFVPFVFSIFFLKEIWRKTDKGQVLILLSTSLPLFFIGWSTLNRDFRYYTFGWLVLALISLSFWFKAPVRRCWQLSLLIILLGLQLGALLPRLFNFHRDIPRYTAQMPDFGGHWVIHPRQENLFIPFVDYLKSLNIPRSAKIGIVDPQLGFYSSDLLDPWALMIRAREQGKYWSFDPYIDGPNNVLRNLQDHFDIVLLAPSLNKESNDQSTAIAKIFFNCKDCKPDGIQIIGRYVAQYSDQKIEILLLKTDRHYQDTDFFPCYENYRAGLSL